MRFVTRCTCAAILLTVTCSISSAQPGVAHDGRLPTVEESLKQHNVELTKPALLQALGSPNAEVRYLAAQKLSQDGAKDAIPQISSALTVEKDPGTKLNIAFALAQLGDEIGTSTLTRGCSDPAIPNALRIRAATYSLFLHDETCLDAVMTLANSDDDFDSKAIALSLLPRFKHLTEHQESAVNDSLKRALLDPTPTVRISASAALAALGNTGSISALDRALASEQNTAVRKQMKASLTALQQKAKH